jgi:UDP:flavonoid glycosyltransferase YjiC (YdhE family)
VTSRDALTPDVRDYTRALTPPLASWDSQRVRVLFTSTQGAGHYEPLTPFIEGCLRVGHEVHVVVPPELEATVAAAGYPHTIGQDPPPAELAAAWSRLPGSSPHEAMELVLGEIFGRLKTEGMLPAVRAVCDAWRPDVVIRELQEYAGAIAADEGGIPHIRIGVLLARNEAVVLRVAAAPLDRFRPGLAARLAASPFLTRFPASLDPSPFDRTTRARDSAPLAPAAEPPGWWDSADEPLVYLTFGSVLGGMDAADAAYETALEAVRGLRARVLLTVGRRFDPARLGDVPANVHVEQWIPQAQVLGHAALVVAHGGAGTTLGTLAAGVPLVVVPIFADQSENADAVSAAGAGLAVKQVGPDQPQIRRLDAAEDAPRIREAIETVLAEPAYRAAARGIADEIAALPTVDAALASLLS